MEFGIGSAEAVVQGIVVVGGGGHAKVLVSVLKKLRHTIVGYTDREDRGALLGAPHLGDDTHLSHLLDTGASAQAAIGVGKVDASSARLRLYDRVTALGFEFPTIVSPDAVTNEEVGLGMGTVVYDGAIVNSGTVTGRVCVLNTSCIVEHDCRLADNVHIAPGAVVSGGVTVGANVMVGAGATIVQNRVIVDGCVVGAGATVIENLRVPGAYVGTPARRIG